MIINIMCFVNWASYFGVCFVGVLWEDPEGHVRG